MTFYGSLRTAPHKQKGTTMAEERADAINSRRESADGDEPDRLLKKQLSPHRLVKNIRMQGARNQEE